jgi:hypothetical protein
LLRKVDAKLTPLASSTLDTNESKTKNDNSKDNASLSNSELTSLKVREKEMEVRNTIKYCACVVL